ncbi:cupin-like domain-containing protein [Sporodiniella umbellata]|nr:cupin-like domain-containing protein [Sporodiniella umbellata]
MATIQDLDNVFKAYVKEYQEINGDYVHIYPSPPSPLEFIKTSVHPNRPAIIQNAFNHWPARTKWNNDYLKSKMGNSQITVSNAVTWDPVTQKEYFVMPYEESMTFDDFLRRMQGSDRAHYISLQNGSLPTEFGALEDDVDKEIDWCSEALGKQPDAVNFWFGDHASITSLHKDPYENCYAVIRGQKKFVLFPPSEYYCMHESMYTNAVYQPNPITQQLEIKPLDSKTPWIPINPLMPDLDRFPNFKDACPIEVIVNEGEMLYLPALWFHQVLQQGKEGVIAINYWYDMDYRSILFPTMNLYRKLLTGVVENNLDVFHSGMYRYIGLLNRPRFYGRGLSSQRSFERPKRQSTLGRVVIGTGLVSFATVSTLAIGGTLLYQTNDRCRHVMKALERCGVAGVVGTQVAYDYYRTLAKDYPNEETSEAAKRACHQRSAARVLAGIQHLGGIYVKLGQHISVMEYILPNEWCETMAVLQDQCQATSPEDVQALFLSDYGLPLEEVFETFDWTPLGVASLAQVHRAKLKKEPGWVAVKLQHPYLDEYCKVDMETVSFIIEMVKKVFPEFGFGWLADEMRESLPKELDFIHEAQNAQKVQANFYEDCVRNEFALVVPTVLWAKRRIMCMEFITGARIDDLDYMKQHGIDPGEVSKELTRVFSEMIFVHGFVHCDPHHGLYRDLPYDLRSNYARLWTSLIKGDEQGICQYAYEVAGTEGYQLFACMLTGREWDKIRQSDLNTTRSESEVDRISVGAIERLTEVADILGKLPRAVLLLLKTNDLLRHVDEKLSASHDERITYAIMGFYCSKAVWLDTKRQLLHSIRTLGFSFLRLKQLFYAWWQHESLVYSLWLYQWAVQWIDTVHRLQVKKLTW